MYKVKQRHEATNIICDEFMMDDNIMIDDINYSNDKWKCISVDININNNDYTLADTVFLLDLKKNQIGLFKKKYDESDIDDPFAGIFSSDDNDKIHG